MHAQQPLPLGQQIDRGLLKAKNPNRLGGLTPPYPCQALFHELGLRC